MSESKPISRYWLLLVIWWVVNTLGYLLAPTEWRQWEKQKKEELWALENIEP